MLNLYQYLLNVEEPSFINDMKTSRHDQSYRQPLSVKSILRFFTVKRCIYRKVSIRATMTEKSMMLQTLKYIAFRFHVILSLEERLRTVRQKCRQNCQGAGFQARLVWESLPKVFKYHHLDGICEMRNFVTDCKAVCVLCCQN